MSIKIEKCLKSHFNFFYSVKQPVLSLGRFLGVTAATGSSSSDCSISLGAIFSFSVDCRRRVGFVCFSAPGLFFRARGKSRKIRFQETNSSRTAVLFPMSTKKFLSHCFFSQLNACEWDDWKIVSSTLPTSFFGWRWIFFCVIVTENLFFCLLRFPLLFLLQ